MNTYLKIIFSFLFLSFSQISFSQEKDIKSDTLHVAGICGMCEERIENAALIKGVKKAEWEKSSHTLVLVYRADKVSLEEIAQAVADAGHDNNVVTASKEAYDKVHKCCKYREDVDH